MKACPECAVVGSLTVYGQLSWFVVAMCAICHEVTFWFNGIHYKPEEFDLAELEGVGE